jgi:DNA-binding Lrp family transcriptional regulator
LASDAFLLINVDPGTEKEVADEIKLIPNVKDVYLTYGVFDLVVKIEAETPEKLKGIITYQVRALKNIQSTLTMIISD